MWKKISLILILFSSVALTACDGNDNNTIDEGNNESTVNVTMQDIYYGDSNDNTDNPPVWHVNANDTVTVQAENSGVLEHNWAIVEPEASLPATITDPAAVESLIFYDIGEVPGGTTGSGVFQAPAPGEYTVICTVPGHYPLMQGRLIVE